MVLQACHPPQGQLVPRPLPNSDYGVLREAIAESMEMLNSARRPIIIVDVMTLRSNAQHDALRLIETTRLPFATLMMGKSIIDEQHPQFIGLYAGSHSRESVRVRVEHSDCILMLGVLWTDFNTGGFSINVRHKFVISHHVSYYTIF